MLQLAKFCASEKPGRNRQVCAHDVDGTTRQKQCQKRLACLADVCTLCAVVPAPALSCGQGLRVVICTWYTDIFSTTVTKVSYLMAFGGGSFLFLSVPHGSPREKHCVALRTWSERAQAEVFILLDDVYNVGRLDYLNGGEIS